MLEQPFCESVAHLKHNKLYCFPALPLTVVLSCPSFHISILRGKIPQVQLYKADHLHIIASPKKVHYFFLPMVVSSSPFLLCIKSLVCVLDLNRPLPSEVIVHLTIDCVYEQSISDPCCHLILLGPRNNFLLHVIKQNSFC